MILGFLRANGRKLTTHTVNSFTELLYIVVGFQVLGYLGITGKMGVADIVGTDDQQKENRGTPAGMFSMLRFSVRQHLKGRRVVVRNVFDVEIRFFFPDHAFRIGNDGQVPQTEKVHFDKAKIADGRHRELCDDDVFIDGQRHIFAGCFRRQNNAGRMGRSVLRHAFQPHGCVDQFVGHFIVFIDCFQIRRFLKRFFNRHMEFVRHQLGQRIHLHQRHAERTANVSDHAPRRHGSKGDNLCNVFHAIALRHILNDFAAAFRAEIDVEIRHGDAFRVQKALKIEGIFHRTDVCDADAVGNQTACAGAPPRADRNALAPAQE